MSPPHHTHLKEFQGQPPLPGPSVRKKGAGESGPPQGLGYLWASVNLEGTGNPDAPPPDRTHGRMLPWLWECCGPTQPLSFPGCEPTGQRRRHGPHAGRPSRCEAADPTLCPSPAPDWVTAPHSCQVFSYPRLCCVGGRVGLRLHHPFPGDPRSAFGAQQAMCLW